MRLRNLAEYRADLSACVRCGACQARCPVYRASGLESGVARGKLEMAQAVLDGRLDMKTETGDAFSRCLLCGACTQTCPNRTPTAAIVAAARREIRGRRGAGMAGRLVGLTGHPRLMGGLADGARRLTPLLFQNIPEAGGLRLRFAPDALRGRRFPPLPERNLFARLPERLPGEAGRPAVAFFAGCAITYLYPEIGEATVRVLRHLGYGVFLPRGQGCCGMPALGSGDGPLAEKLALANIRAFSETEEGAEAQAIVTACASCGGMLRHLYREFGDSEATALAERVTDIHVFLRERGDIRRLKALFRAAPPVSGSRRRVIRHDPCHLKNRGITEAPRELLRVLPQVEFVDAPGADLCCGLGGTFAVTQPGLSRDIAAAKARALENACREQGADTVAADCPGCLLQLADIIHQRKLPLRAAHGMTLVAEALDAAGTKRGPEP